MRIYLAIAVALVDTVTACRGVYSQEPGVGAKSARELEGLCVAKLRFGPDVRRSTIERVAGDDRAGKDSLATAVDKLFAEWNKPSSPGCALAIVRDGKVVYETAYGMAK